GRLIPLEKGPRGTLKATAQTIEAPEDVVRITPELTARAGIAWTTETTMATLDVAGGRRLVWRRSGGFAVSVAWEGSDMAGVPVWGADGKLATQSIRAITLDQNG